MQASVTADLRFALRTLGRSPGFVLAAVLGCGLAIGAVTTVFAIIDAALLRPLPYGEPGRLVVVWDQLRTLGFSRFPVTMTNYLHYRGEPVFAQVEAWRPNAVMLRQGEATERVPAARATSGLLPLLEGESLAIGRWFNERENVPGNGAVAVLSDAAWRRWFNGDTGVLSKRVLIDEEPYEVVGVLAPSFRFLPAGAEVPEVWLPMAVDKSVNAVAGRLIARLAAGVSVEQASARMRDMAARLVREERAGMGPNGEDGGFGIAVTPLREELYGALRPALYAVAGATVVLLLMGCCNTAFLWLTRASQRRREMAVREALGASFGRLLQQRLVEGGLVAALSGAAGLALAWAAMRWIGGAGPAALAGIGAVRMDWRVLAFTTLIAGAVGMVCSVLAVWRLRTDGALSNRSGTPGVRESRARWVLIAAQSALTCGLLVAALLLGRSFVKLMQVEPGFQAAGLTAAQVSLPPRYKEPAQVEGFYRRLHEKIEAGVGPLAATLTSQLPLSFGSGGDPFSIEGRPYRSTGGVPQIAHAHAIGPDYFELLKVPLITGRVFEPRDFAGNGDVAVISKRLADGFWPGESALGHRIVLGAPRPGVQWATIIGVVGDVRTESLLREASQIYLPMQRLRGRGMAVIVRGGDSAIGAARRAVAEIDPGAALYGVASLSERVSGSIAGPRTRAAVFAGYSMLAFALAVFGVWSLMSYSVAGRTREFAVRSALGAAPGGVMSMLIGEAVRVVGIGVICGMGLVAAFGSVLRGLLFGVSEVDPWSYAAAAALVIGVSAAAALWPAWRASRVEAARVLAGE
jgi:putative ABC transport system permease protein